MTYSATPGQTIGPFFGYALPFTGDSDLVPRSAPSAIRLHGRVLDGAGDPVPDAIVEVWQVDADGNVVTRQGSLHRDGWTFTGWGRCATDAGGRYSFTTLTPGGSVAFFALAVFARGLLDRLFTRAYLPEWESSVPSSVPAERRKTLVATADEHGFVFEVVLQGHDETVFLSYPGSPGA